ncbi:MAG: hypothetical protein KatS3mg007_0736 [Thermoanaerobaculum sp.]|nr:MAG: hypothetical protein KatS3mg007_0736 [Thermoanaerobaculum sp.]
MLRARFLLAPVILGAVVFSRGPRSAPRQPVDPNPPSAPAQKAKPFATQAAKAWVVAC